MSRSRVLFIIESGSDVRLVEVLAEQFELSVLARRIVGGRELVRERFESRVMFQRLARSIESHLAFGTVNVLLGDLTGNLAEKEDGRLTTGDQRRALR